MHHFVLVELATSSIRINHPRTTTYLSRSRTGGEGGCRPYLPAVLDDVYPDSTSLSSCSCQLGFLPSRAENSESVSDSEDGCRWCPGMGNARMGLEREVNRWALLLALEKVGIVSRPLSTDASTVA